MLEDLKIHSRYDGLIYLADTLSLPRLKPHRHEELELNLVVRGEITYVVDGKRVHLPQRTLLWLFPDQEHQLVGSSDGARYYVVVFKQSLIQQACGGPNYRQLQRDAGREPGVLQYEMAPDQFDEACRAMSTLTEEGLDPDVLNREAGYGSATTDFHFEHDDPDWLNAGLRQLLLLCWRFQRGASRSTSAVVMHPAVRHVLQRLSECEETETLAKLARECGVTESYLSRVFTAQVGTSISQYRNAVRLRRFWDLYKDSTKTTLTQAAYGAGFGSYAQFYRVFSEAYGRGPRELFHSGRSRRHGENTPPMA